MTTAALITYGLNTSSSTYGKSLLITGGLSSRGSPVFNRVISAMEKKNVAVNWIEPEYIEDGLADETILDSIVASAEKKSVTVSWIDPRFIKAGLADHTLMDAIIGRVEG
jgi:hypothetical protein